MVSSSGSPARTCTSIVPSAAIEAVAPPPVGSVIQPTSPRAAASNTAASSQPAPRMADDVGGPTTSTSSTVTSGATLAMASTIPGVRARGGDRSRRHSSHRRSGRFGPVRTTSSRASSTRTGWPCSSASRRATSPSRTRASRRTPHRCPAATPARHRAHTRTHRSRGRPVRSRWSGALRRSPPRGARSVADSRRSFGGPESFRRRRAPQRGSRRRPTHRRRARRPARRWRDVIAEAALAECDMRSDRLGDPALDLRPRAAASASPKVTGVPKTSQASSTGCHPVHRHMWASKASAALARSSWEISLARRPSKRQTMPGVQKPHWLPPVAANASPQAARTSGARPSTVVTSRPARGGRGSRTRRG